VPGKIKLKYNPDATTPQNTELSVKIKLFVRVQHCDSPAAVTYLLKLVMEKCL
jgi:hypothetical protein